jgi:hypothetical protein
MKLRDAIKQLIGISIWFSFILTLVKLLNGAELEWFVVFLPLIFITLVVSLYNFFNKKESKKNGK